MSFIDVLIDVRSPEEYAAGHLRGALNIPVHELTARLAGLDCRRARLAVYCRSGRRSAIAAALLRGHGYERVTDLGGLEQARVATDCNH